MVVHTVHKGCSSDIPGVHDTHEERAPIIGGPWVGSRTAAPPWGRASLAGQTFAARRGGGKERLVTIDRFP